MRKALIILPAAFGIAVSAPTWKPLFDGKTFAGWSVVGDQSYWKILPDSSIGGQLLSGTPTSYSMVFTDKADFDQFTIKYQYRLKAGCSGFFFRSVRTETTEKVRGMQVEAKYLDNGQRQVGALYCHQCKDQTGAGIDGWIPGSGNNALAYDRKIDRPDDQYQDVVLTVKNPFVYVNVNGFQPIGGSEAGDQPPFRYDRTPIISAPGRLGLQVHGSQTRMDVAFKNIMILEGCTDATSPKRDTAQFLPGMEKHPVVYQHNQSLCSTTGIEGERLNPVAHFGKISERDGQLQITIKYSKPHEFELVSLQGKTVFSGSAPGANTYRVANPVKKGVYFARIVADGVAATRKILIQ